MLDRILDILKNGNDRIIYKVDGKEITYYECYKKVLNLSNSLMRQGNEPIILYGHKSIDQFISILSCILAKRCYIPIDVYMPKFRIREIIRQTKASLLIKNEDCEFDNIECLSVDEINIKYSELSNSFDNDNEYAYIIFTSGSTGNSKGVPISYDNLNNFIEWITSLNEFKSCYECIVLSQASFSFDLSVMDIYFSIFKNFSIISVDIGNNISFVLDAINKEKINFLVMTPSFIKLLLLDNNFNSDNYSFINYMFFCGECLEVEAVKKIRCRFPNVHIINAYGPSEATCCVSLLEIKDYMFTYDYLPVGRISTSAVNIEIKKDEIILKGKSVFDNYLGNRSDKCYIENGINVYETGDIGEIKEDFLYCYGRVDSQIKYLGYRIELMDIELNLLKIDGIREAVVVCKYKDNSNIVKLIKAFVVLDKNIDIKAIKKELSDMIPNYMIPKIIVILDKIPVNNNGKYNRKRLCDL